MSVLLARAGILAKQTIASTVDPSTIFDRGYGAGSDLGADASTITSWGHTLSLVTTGDGTFNGGPTPFASPVVATDTGKKVARFTASATDPTILGAALSGAETMPFEVWMVAKFAAPIAGHVSAFFSPQVGSTMSAKVAAGASFPRDVSISAGDSNVVISSTSLPGAWHVWRFVYNDTTGSIEVDGSSVASGALGGSATLGGFYLGSGFYGSDSSDYDVAAWGISSTVLSSGSAADALTYMTAQKP